MKIRVYHAFLIARLQISKFNKKLYRQSKLLPVANKFSNYYLLTGCKGRTRKYKPKVFHTARACEGCLENQWLVFPGTARVPS